MERVRVVPRRPRYSQAACVHDAGGCRRSQRARDQSTPSRPQALIREASALATPSGRPGRPTGVGRSLRINWRSAGALRSTRPHDGGRSTATRRRCSSPTRWRWRSTTAPRRRRPVIHSVAGAYCALCGTETAIRGPAREPAACGPQCADALEAVDLLRRRDSISFKVAARRRAEYEHGVEHPAALSEILLMRWRAARPDNQPQPSPRTARRNRRPRCAPRSPARGVGCGPASPTAAG